MNAKPSSIGLAVVGMGLIAWSFADYISQRAAEFKVEFVEPAELMRMEVNKHSRLKMQIVNVGPSPGRLVGTDAC
ncbi:MAG TPA: hypothetical protein PKD64_10090 [Pirellulaceae bacterium]|nr:hypothetical protein [Pirellulaceae bacterium]HMO92531.1 hypothetical protein [Pirellulaceae bacterium]HMP68986.1 hypothetical protein [Pirellulaceae bacterium]